ncbi:MAG: DUF835 domain-containing protein [Thermoplasmata archaeon]
MGPPGGPPQRERKPMVLAGDTSTPETIPAEMVRSARSIKELGLPGRSSLLLSPSPSPPYRIFHALLKNRNGMVVSGVHPNRLKEKYGIEGTDFLWITEYTGASQPHARPQDLEYEVLGRVISYMKRKRGGVLFLDDIEYLMAQLGLETVLRFVKGTSDGASEHGATFLATLDPLCLSDRELLSISKCFDTARPLGESSRLVRSYSRPLPLPATSSLLMASGPEAYRLLGLLSLSRKAICLTPISPAKLRERYGLAKVDFIWLTETSTSKEAIPPTKLGYEVQREALAHIRSAERPLIFLDALELIRPFVPFQESLRFVKCVCDACIEHSASVIAAFNPSAFEKKEAALLAKRFDIVRWGV